MKSSRAALRSKQAGPAEAAGQYDADRGAKLSAASALAQARALVEAVRGVDGGEAALRREFANLAARRPVFEFDALVAAAGGKGTKAYKRLEAFCAERGVGGEAPVKGAAKRLARADDLVTGLRLGVEAQALTRALGRAFPAFMRSESLLDLDAIAGEAVADAGVMARLKALAVESGVAPAANTRAVRAARRKVEAYGGAAVDVAQKKGAALPNVELMTKRSWRVEVVDTPIGSTAKPAYVVQIDGNAPLGRLSRPARPGEAPALEPRHVRAAEEVCALYFASMKSAKLVGSYEGVVVDTSGGSKAHMIDVACASWAKLDGAMRALLPVERDVVMSVAVYETPIDALVKRHDLAPMRDVQRRHGAVLQALRCGLERLSMAWGIDAAQSRDA